MEWMLPRWTRVASRASRRSCVPLVQCWWFHSRLLPPPPPPGRRGVRSCAATATATTVVGPSVRHRRRAGSVSLRERTEKRARTRQVGEENRGTRSVVSRTPHRHHPTLRDNLARARATATPCDNCETSKRERERLTRGPCWPLSRFLPR